MHEGLRITHPHVDRMAQYAARAMQGMLSDCPGWSDEWLTLIVANAWLLAEKMLAEEQRRHSLVEDGPASQQPKDPPTAR